MILFKTRIKAYRVNNFANNATLEHRRLYHFTWIEATKKDIFKNIDVLLLEDKPEIEQKEFLNRS